jgi:pilus assembly protein Flp/PilA
VFGGIRLLQKFRSEQTISVALAAQLLPPPCFREGHVQSLMTGVRKLVRNEEGAALVEYGLLIALIAVICVIVIATLGNTVSAKFSQMNSLFQ